MLRRSLLLAGSLLLPLSAAAETYHVAPGGNDSNDGSASAPWARFCCKNF